MTNLLWAKMPTDWVRFDDGLTSFRSDELATSVAALKIYLMLCLQANRTPTPLLKEAGMVHVSYADIMEWANLSRAVVAGGIDKLRSEALIEYEEVRGKNLYRVASYDVHKGWAKVPTALVSSGVIKRISARSKVGLNALKLYVLFLAQRNSVSSYASIGYDKIMSYTNIRRNDILPAVSVLTEARLVTCDRELRGDGEFSHSQYFLHHLGHRPQTRVRTQQQTLADMD